MSRIIKSSEKLNADLYDEVCDLTGQINQPTEELVGSLNTKVNNLDGVIGIPYISGGNSKFVTTDPVSNPIGEVLEGTEYDIEDRITLNDIINKMLHSNEHTINYTIKSLNGTIQNKIYLNKLPSGLYRIIGNYQVIKDVGTNYVNANYANLFIIDCEQKIIIRICNGITMFTINEYDTEYEKDEFAKISDIPTKLSEFENDCGFVNSEEVEIMINKALEENVKIVPEDKIDDLFD